MDNSDKVRTFWGNTEKLCTLFINNRKRLTFCPDFASQATYRLLYIIGGGVLVKTPGTMPGFEANLTLWPYRVITASRDTHWPIKTFYP